MDFGKYIHELLLENEIVIVPGFGAFVTEYKPAEINAETGEMKPPTKLVSFNQQIRNNDGLLVGYVSEKKRVSHFEALKRIEKERENILYNLDSGEKVELSEVGTLFYKEDNNIGFQAIEDENILLESFGLEVTSVEPPKDAEEEIVPVTPPREEEGTEEIIEGEETEDKEIPETPASEETKEDKVTEPAPEIVMSHVSSESSEKKKKRGWLWLLLIFVPMIAVSVYIILNEKELIGLDKGETPESKVQINEESTAFVQDSVQKEENEKDSVELVTSDTESVQESLPETKTIPETATPKYYLVGGSFAIEENAETYLKELKDKGFDAFHVGKKGRFFIVGIGTYNTFGEAEKAKNEYMTNNPGSEVWVYKK